ncbi:transposase family protein [Aquibacillus sp. 3ASR75-11]|uniref:Transposase family protein n=1 Tax=Terrihalobacillus insolitus TaxID=2950438 RepID=A0A9X4AQ88_9BACI|nr:transposase family protein [Terrihalobacillus insolitus]MDC3426383.1 transposase family protein [Terrihalobacillus insolitus]
MATRKEKRDQETEVNYFIEFAKIKKHYFNELFVKLNQVKDPRHQSYIYYQCDVILLMMILKNACDLKSMRGMTSNFNKEECIKNIQKVIGLKELEELPHYDTINNFLERLEPGELEAIRTYMIQELLNKRCLERYRINGKYWGVIIDGTGLFSFSEKHCDHCLKREYKNEETDEKRTVYMHHVLEAKLVVGDMVLSIGSEFIENESEDVPKQDCELNAFHRLAKKLKDTYKRLPICILGDSLYACESVFKRCDSYKWVFMMRFKEGRIRSVANEFQTIKSIKSDTNGPLFWVNDISYQERSLNVLEGTLENEEGKDKSFLFITNIKLTKRNAKKMVGVGRSRWKIENQGFNRQKNIRYHIEHAGSLDHQAMKNHYLLTQITDILMQLYENGAKIFKKLKKTAKEISSDLLEAFRTRILTGEDIATMVKPIQVRFT